MFKLLTTLSFLLLTACMMVGPNYKEPKKDVADHWLKRDSSVKESRIKNANWWAVFKDSNLTALINQGYQNNLSLQSAGVNVLKARASLAQAVGALYPQQQAMIGSLNYNRIGGGSLQEVLPSNFYTGLLGFSANWEIDFWGKYRRAILANNAAFLSSFAAYDIALVTLTADIATVYIDIRTTENLIKVTKDNIKVQALGYQIAKARFNAGEASLLDVEQAKTELAETQSSLPQYVANLQKQKDALAVLLGTTPNNIDALILKKHGIPKAPSSVAVGIPRESLINRPDIYQARMDAIVQSESIGAVKANLYPSLALGGTFAFGANTITPNNLSQIFNWSNRTASAGPSINWSILNYGQITNAVRAQDAAFQQSLLKYLNLVLQAQQEVQDNITQFIEVKKSEKFLTEANTAAIKSTHLAMVRYREGESDFTPVLDAERQELRVQKSLVIAKGDIPKALVALYRALGGGWQIRHCNDIVPEKIKKEMAGRTNWGSLLKTQNHVPPASRKKQLEEIYLPNW